MLLCVVYSGLLRLHRRSRSLHLHGIDENEIKYTVVSRMVTFTDGFSPERRFPERRFPHGHILGKWCFLDGHFPRVARFPEKLFVNGNV